MSHPGKKKFGKSKRPKIVGANLYGIHAVCAAWLNPSRFVHQLYITQEALKHFEPVMKEAEEKGLKRPEPQIVDKNKLDHMLLPGAVHQGMALQAQDLAEVSLEALVHAAGAHGGTFAMLDQVTDPHNVGAILRSASAFGLSGVIMQRKHAPALEGVLAKAACGAVEYMPVAYETNLARAIEYMQNSGYPVYGLDERGAQTLKENKPFYRSVIVLGSEGKGLRRLVREKCDALVRLPTQGPIAALNVSNAAAVAFYDLAETQ